MRDDVGGLAHVRSQLVWVAGVAATVIVVLAITGVTVASAGWYPAVATAVGVTVGTVVVAVVCVAWAALLFRGLPTTPVVVRREVVRPEPVPPPFPAVAEADSKGSAPRPRAVEPESTPFATGDQRGEMLATLSQRLQSLVNQLIRKIDRVENEIEDPDLLHMVWEVDHLATRARRETENIAVLGGEALQRRSDTPVDVNAVLRAAVAEVQHYRRVTKIPVHNASIQGHVVSEIIHLLAELVENAATFTPDDAPKVAVRAHYVAAGLEILVQDRGLGMYAEDMETVNRLLNGTTQVDIGRLLKDGRIGLAVVKELAQRHGIAVQLQSNIYGGVDASVVVPDSLLGPRPADAHGDNRRHRRPFHPAAEAVAQATAAESSSRALSGTPSGTPGPAQGVSAPANPKSIGSGVGSPDQTFPPVGAPLGRHSRTMPSDIRSDQSRLDQARSEQARSDQAWSEQARLDHPWSDQPRADQARPDQVRSDRPRPDQLRSDPSRLDLQGRPDHHSQAELRGPQPGAGRVESRLNSPERRRPGAALAALEGGQDPGEPTAAWMLTETTQAPSAPPASDLGTTATTNTVGGGATLPETGAARPVDRPVLPHRRARQTHLRPELHTPAGHTRPIPGHNPNLIADLHLGQARGDAELAHGDDRADDDAGSAGTDNPGQPPQQPPLTHAQGDTSSWPRI